MTAPWLWRVSLSMRIVPHERGDGLDRIRHCEESDWRQSRVRQASAHAFADRPDMGFAGKSGQGLHRKIGHYVVELPHQPLIRPEHDRTDCNLPGASFAFGHRHCRRAFAEANA